MSFFKDLSVNNKLALFICKDKDDKDTRATTLIVRPPMIGCFSKKWESRIRPSNLLECSMTISHGPEANKLGIFIQCKWWEFLTCYSTGNGWRMYLVDANPSLIRLVSMMLCMLPYSHTIMMITS